MSNATSAKIHLDSPAALTKDGGVYVMLHGWYAGKEELRKASVFVSGQKIDCQLHSRPDVALAYPKLITGGFMTVLDCSSFDSESLPSGGGTLALQILANDENLKTFRLKVEPGVSKQALACREMVAKKVAWLKQALKPQHAQTLVSTPVNCLTDFHKESLSIDETINISNHRYDGIAIKMIDEAAARGGMVLDCGAGLRHESHANVIACDVVDYPSSDVICPNEELPFKDNVFDVVLSLNVLEHVADPAASAREIMRVLKPSGKVYAVVPFLQPEHAYPNHFYNMTRAGLRRMFEGKTAASSWSGEIASQWVSDAGHPVAALHWFLRSYAAGLPKARRKKFLSLSVKDILAHTPEEWLGEGIARDLSEEARWELACTTSLIVEKQ
jgi:SAM-dependent methyltransferase